MRGERKEKKRKKEGRLKGREREQAKPFDWVEYYAGQLGTALKGCSLAALYHQHTIHILPYCVAPVPLPSGGKGLRPRKAWLSESRSPKQNSTFLLLLLLSSFPVNQVTKRVTLVGAANPVAVAPQVQIGVGKPAFRDFEKTERRKIEFASWFYRFLGMNAQHIPTAAACNLPNVVTPTTKLLLLLLHNFAIVMSCNVNM